MLVLNGNWNVYLCGLTQLALACIISRPEGAGVGLLLFS